MPNNRQWATLIWVGAFIVFLLVRRDLRSSLGQVLRAAISPKILIPLLVFLGWVTGLVITASRTDLWGTPRVTDTAFWVVTAGLVLFGSFDKVSKEPRFVRRTAYTTVKAGAFIEVFTEVFVLGLVAELILLPVVTFLVLLSVVAARNPEHHLVKRLVDWLMTAFGFGVLAYVSIEVISEWGALDKGDVQQFALPIWLTIGILPYIYMLGLLATYGMAFVRIDLKTRPVLVATDPSQGSADDHVPRAGAATRRATRQHTDAAVRVRFVPGRRAGSSRTGSGQSGRRNRRRQLPRSGSSTWPASRCRPGRPSAGSARV